MARAFFLQAGPGAERLGSEPLRKLFGRVAVPCAQLPAAGAHLTRRRLMSVDGVELEVPDTPANAARVGYRLAKGGHGPFPQSWSWPWPSAALMPSPLPWPAP